ncbi:MAG: thiamine pyrophosphate-dependent enzyme [Candidatus Parvarchaeota archaeon]
MKLNDAINSLVNFFDDNSLVVCIFGQVSDELYKSGDSSKYFYMRGGMGLASSIALGVAITTPKKKVFALDGDGSLIMNIGSLASIAHYRPKNLYHIIIDNHVHGSVGGYDTFTASTLNLASVIKGFGIASVFETADKDQLDEHLKRIIKMDGPHAVVIKTEFEKSPGKGHATRMNYVKERFMYSINPENPNLPDI